MGPKKGDTPYPLQYIVSQESLSDNGGSFIARGTIKLMVKEQDLDLRHFEAIDDGDEISFTGTDNKQQIVHFINYVSRCRTTGHINGKYSTSAFRIDVDNVSLMLSPGSYILGRADMGLNEKLVGIGADTVHIDAYGAFFQAPLKTTGEYNHVIQIDISKNVTIKGLKAISGGDGLYIDSPITRDNNGYGILVILGTYINEAKKNVDITIVNHTSIRDGQDGTRGGLGM
ncbi:hypothetical protein [Sphingobacterium siyangense]|uniref:hypothetical protein n=1 Tax=Sphingobacterium siyangense TaxID=459529 RepID=UPI002FD94DB9